MKAEVSIGNVISWVLMTLVLGLISGIFKGQLDVNAKDVARLDENLTLLSNEMSLLRIENAENNERLKSIRVLLEHMDIEQQEFVKEMRATNRVRSP